MSAKTMPAGPPSPSSGVLDAWDRVVMPTYGRPSIALVRGQGPVVVDDCGKEYLDLLGGIAVNLLGHAHPAVVDAVSRQVATLGHVGNLYAHPTVVALAERLLGLLGAEGRVFFCNSGAEANEAAFKLSRRTGRTRVVAAAGAFHGRTMGSLALTGQPAKRAPFLPLPGDVVHVPFGDGPALAAAVDEATAAVFLEPILGEAGVVMPPEGYLREARAVCDAHGSLLVIDEVQTGLGRTGSWFAFQAEGIRPDVVTLSKGLGGGLPLGACIGLGAAGTMLEPGQHGTTFGGNPVVCAAALAVLDVIENQDLPGRATILGKRLADGIRRMESPLLLGVRGRGLMLGIELARPVAGALEAELRAAGFLVNAPAPDVIRLLPPLVISDEQADSFLAALPDCLAAVDSLEQLAASADAAMPRESADPASLASGGGP